MANKVEREIVDALRSSNLPFEIVVGRRHKHVWIAGRMIGVFSLCSTHGRDAKFFLTKIRRAVEEYSRSITTPDMKRPA